MNYNFIKEKLKTLFDEQGINKSVLEVLIEGQENSFILNHNIEAIEHMLKFLSGSNNVLVINGFMGEGKTYCADFITNFIDENVLIFKNSYQEAINLDDVFLSMFRDFSIYHNEKIVNLPKTDTSIFSEKINSYIKYCNVPMLFIFDSFEINTRSNDTRKDILDFINFLSKFEKIKVIICSRTFKKSELQNTAGVEDYLLNPLTKEETKKYLDLNKIEGNNFDIQQFHNEIRGHYVLLELSVFIMEVLGLNLSLFFSEYKKFYKNFLEFLISKILSTTSDKYLNLILFLSAIRHGVSSEFIITRGLAANEDLDFLLQKHVITEKYDKYYVKDYIRNEFIKTINNIDKVKVHEYLINIYQSELPLKPFERGLFLSRQTMRQEIIYHQNKRDTYNEQIEKSVSSSEPQDFNYLSYSRVSGYDEKKLNKPVKPKRYLSELRKKNKAFEDLPIITGLGNDDNLTKNMKEISQIEENQIESSEKTAEYTKIPDSIDDFIKIAQEYSNAYNYSNAILYYKKALSYKKSPDYADKEIIIYEKLALCYQRIQDIDEAVKYYELIYKSYLNKDGQKAGEILLTVARMYLEAYKFDMAKEYYKRILSSSYNISSEFKIRIYLDLSELEDNNMNIKSALEYAGKALNEAEKTADIKLLSECYFKYGLILDDSGNSEIAVKYYLRCVQTSNNPEENLYISSAYSNLAELALDNNNYSAAKMYYELALEADKSVNNYEGLYYSYSKLAELYKKDKAEKAHELLLKALSSAKKLDDVSYSANVYVKLGDYYTDTENYKGALKAFVLAKTLLPAYSSDETNKKINSKLTRIKTLIGERSFEQYIDEIKKKK